VKEGKIELKAACDGLFLVDSARLLAVNTQDEVMIATRKGGTAVKKDDKLADMRVIPLIISSSKRKEVLLSLPVKKHGDSIKDNATKPEKQVV
jgi:hypothetical protein